jgi:hypothetical protein
MALHRMIDHLPFMGKQISQQVDFSDYFSPESGMIHRYAVPKSPELVVLLEPSNIVKNSHGFGQKQSIIYKTLFSR